jgi:outer membrane protein OmpA-like peptidoglycan-associated protein/ABC-type nitrate/sulfonate/bicarbonate transport system substrate-binding protein
MKPLTRFNKLLVGTIVLGGMALAYKTYGPHGAVWTTPPVESRGGTSAPARARAAAPTVDTAAVDSVAVHTVATLDARPVRVGLSQWPGHLALVVGAGGLNTQPQSIAAEEGLNLEIVFLEDAATKNAALKRGDVDFVWQTVDELPISLGQTPEPEIWAKAFLQIDWSRGGDACIATSAVKRAEDLVGRRAAMLRFSPDHTVFEFMVTNSRLDQSALAQVRANTLFSADDFSFDRRLFVEGKVDVACLWEPDVSLALLEKPGAHRLFSTLDATELVADVLLARPELLEKRPDVAEKLGRVWFRSVAKAEADRKAAAHLIAATCSRFRDELGEQGTLDALAWVKWATLRDNVRFFGLDASAPAFDRIYNQADAAWVNYPEAQVKLRFPPNVLRDERVLRALWEQAGRPPAPEPASYDLRIAARAAPLFTKPLALPFGVNARELDPNAMAILNRDLMPQLEIARAMLIRVEGNTDPTGSEPYNRMLSTLRAEAVREYLVARGVPRERVQARGNGSKKPVASNTTPEGRAQNRRTEVLFIPTAT